MNKKIIYQYYAIVIIFTVVDFLFGSGYAAFMNKQGLNNLELGQIFMIWSIFSLFFGLPFATLGDRYGRKKIMSIGFCLWGIGLFIFCHSFNYLSFLIAFILIASSQALIGQLPIAWFLSSIISTPLENEKGKVIPIAEALSKGVSFLTGCIFSIVLVNVNNKGPYIISSAISIIFSFFMFFKYKESAYEKKEDYSYIYYLKQSIKNISKSRVLILFSLKTFIGNTAGQIFVFCWQLYMIQELHVKDYLLGPTFSVFILSLSLGYFLSSKMGKKFNKNTISILGSIIILLGFIIIVLTKGIVPFILGAILFEVGLGIEQGATLVWIQSEIWEDSRATTLSFIPIIGALSRLVASSIITPILSINNYTLIWNIAITMSFCTILVLYKIKKIKLKLAS